MCTCLRHNGANPKLGVKEGKGVFLEAYGKWLVYHTDRHRNLLHVTFTNSHDCSHLTKPQHLSHLVRVFPKYFVVVTSETKAISIVNSCNCCWLLHIRLGWSCMWKAIQ